MALEQLELQNNRLEGPIPSTLGGLVRLRLLRAFMPVSAVCRRSAYTTRVQESLPADTLLAAAKRARPASPSPSSPTPLLAPILNPLFTATLHL